MSDFEWWMSVQVSDFVEVWNTGNNKRICMLDGKAYNKQWFCKQEIYFSIDFTLHPFLMIYWNFPWIACITAQKNNSKQERFHLLPPPPCAHTSFHFYWFFSLPTHSVLILVTCTFYLLHLLISFAMSRKANTSFLSKRVGHVIPGVVVWPCLMGWCFR